jgi:branched-chain amino acid transport system substrate-binding protein
MSIHHDPALRRRTLLKAGLAVPVLAAPPIISARGETPLRLGMVNPLTGILSALAQSEVEGAKLAVEQINKKNGILGRQVELLVEDSANDTGTGVQKTRKLIERDKVEAILGDVNSGIAYAMSQVTAEAKMFHIVPGGHTDPITGKDCKWNVFRICNTTSMDAAAITASLVKRFGKRFFFISPDYAYGRTLQESFNRNLAALGGESQIEFLPINNSDFSATLIKAKAYKPDVLLNNMAGQGQVNCMKQFVQFGMQKDMHLGGALFEMENVNAVPKDAQTGSWVMEWWWDQPDVPEVGAFVADIRKAYGKAPSARHWFGFVAVHSVRLGAEKAGTMEGPKLAKAMEGLELPRDVALQPGKVFYRAGDHQLMPNLFVGDVHPAGKSPEDIFTLTNLVPGEQAAGSVESTGCVMVHPA